MPDAPFVWGVAAASAQTESRKGRGRSNWDVFSDARRILDHSTNETCTQFDQRYIEDLDLLSAAGVPAFRLSAAWPRLQPDGPDRWSTSGLDFYSRLVDAMLERGIEPWLTMFHWDIPAWAGDFRDRDIAARLGDYAAFLTKGLGDRVKNWIVLNEPNTVAVLGYAAGRHAPGLTSAADCMAASHHQSLALGLMARAARSNLPAKTALGTTVNLAPVRPATSSDADRAAALRIDALWNRAFLDPLFGLGYPAGLPLVDLVRDGDLKTIATRLDFLGLNYYARAYVRCADNGLGVEESEPPAHLPRTRIFHVEPDGLREILLLVKDRYGSLPVYITETGFALKDSDVAAERTDDALRVEYLDSYLEAAAAARADGVDLRGLFYWSATDNWEWAEGFSARYGLIAVEPGTQKRLPKKSLAMFRGMMQRHFPDAAVNKRDRDA